MQSFIPALPEGFAQQVIDLEGELDTLCDLANVQKLLELYREAIEHYESLRNPIYHHYRERKRQLFARDDVQALLLHPTESSSRPHRPSYQKQRLEAKRRAFAKNLTNYSDLAATRTAEKEIASHNTKSSSVLRKLQENIQHQCSALHSRMRQRRQKNFSVDWTHAGRAFEEYEAQMEKLMEWFFQSKEQAAAAIQQKYEIELADINELKHTDALFDAVSQAAQQRMNAEIEEAFQNLEQEKQQRIAALRRSLALV